MEIPENFDGFGWMTPRGKIIQCPKYGHLEALYNHPEVQKIHQIQDGLKELAELEESCQETADSLGSTHAEWHIYEMACDSFRNETLKRLYNYGFIRIGTVSWHIEFEGKGAALGDKKTLLEDFVQEYEAMTSTSYSVSYTRVKT